MTNGVCYGFFAGDGGGGGESWRLALVAAFWWH